MTDAVLAQSKTYTNPDRRQDFIMMFEVTLGNPNGDPDADNMPRQDQETDHGLVTDVCIKRKIRNYVALTQSQNSEGRNRIYVQDKGIYLNDIHKEAHAATGIPLEQAKNPPSEKRNAARDWMCQHFYDVRIFGAVMGTKINSGQVRGPVQLTFARSIEPILASDVSVSRVALTDESEKKAAEKRTETADETTDERRGSSGTFGRKAIIPYALYVAHGFYTPAFGKQTGVTAEDLDLFWSALMNMWELDHSASRGMMSCRGLYVFSHASSLGNGPSHTLFSRLSVKRNPHVEYAREFRDYAVKLDDSALPEGISLTRLIDG